jgi:hypothetical protein
MIREGQARAQPVDIASDPRKVVESRRLAEIGWGESLTLRHPF